MPAKPLEAQGCVAMKSLLDKSVLDRAGGLIKPLLQPLVGFGLALVALTWLGTWHTINIERESLRLNNERDAANIALIFEQNVSRTARSMAFLNRCAAITSATVTKPIGRRCFRKNTSLTTPRFRSPSSMPRA